ncbi:hypothetical protein LPTSP4_06470 [Leptospira ryugenii]|uniref:Amidohydrolase n=1 Tax=Leptospira ryugenii TaxID=1917863 RepID=A0A2P2DWY2_9LEPT|nr:amidohydrolase [Leptospira ryugenii]GBF49137.1 hypothetical protein LPTSP4_06470 [Leptospira ryugenii]
MAVVKIALYQKNIHKKLSAQEIQKIADTKAHFFLLPSGFPYFFQATDAKESAAHAKEYQDHVIEISESYPGVILGGSHIRKSEDGSLLNSCPIIQSMVLVDFYDQKWFSSPRGKGLTKGDSESIFIMGGLRFGILLAEEIMEESLWEEFKREGLELIFHLGNQDSNVSYEDDLAFYADLSRKHGLQIIRVCGVSDSLKGRSLYATPSGINWKVGKTEESSDVLKTLSVNLRSTFFL